MFLKMTSRKTLIFTAFISVLLLVLPAHPGACNEFRFLVYQGRVDLCAVVRSKGGHARDGPDGVPGKRARRVQR